MCLEAEGGRAWEPPGPTGCEHRRLPGGRCKSGWLLQEEREAKTPRLEIERGLMGSHGLRDNRAAGGQGHGAITDETDPGPHSRDHCLPLDI